MNAVQNEWVEKADEDYRVALRELRVRRNPAFNAVCFHAQQCAEKYLKAILQQRGKPFFKTHDLDLLLTDCLEWFPLWEAMRSDLKRLARYAVLFRYPGESADKQEAQRAVLAMRRCRQDVRIALGLPTPASLRSRPPRKKR